MITISIYIGRSKISFETCTSRQKKKTSEWNTRPSFDVSSFLFLMFFSWSIVRHQTNKGKEVMATAWIFFHFLVDSFSNMRWENLHQCGCCQSSHGVVLDCSSWKVSISHKGKVIDSPKIWLTLINFYYFDEL